MHHNNRMKISLTSLGKEQNSRIVIGLNNGRGASPRALRLELIS